MTKNENPTTKTQPSVSVQRKNFEPIFGKNTTQEPLFIEKTEDEVRQYAESITKTVREPVIVLNQDLRVVSASQSFCEVFEVKSEEIVGQLVYDLGNKQWDMPKLRKLLEEILLTKSSFDNYEIERESVFVGSRKILLNAHRIPSPPEKLKVILLAIEDIAERRMLEEANIKLAAIVESADDAIIGEDMDGIIESWNKGAEIIYGYSAPEVIGKSVTLLIRRDQIDECKSVLAKIACGETIKHYETKGRKKDGQIIDVSMTISPIKNILGEIIGASTIAHDITIRKIREAELHRLNQTLRAQSQCDQALMRAVDETDYLNKVCGIIVRECGRAMVWIGLAENDENKSIRPAASSGFDEGYLETLKITWADTEFGQGPTGTAIRTGKPRICGNMMTDPAFKPWREEAAKRGYASSIVFPLMADDKAFGALSIYAREPDPFIEDEVKLLSELANDLALGITAIRLRASLKKANEDLEELATELKRAAKVKTEFLSNMSHELRTPLTSINGFSEILYDEFYGPLNEKQKVYVNNILTSGQHLLLLINQILDMAKVEAGKMKLALSSLSMKRLLTDISMLVADMASKKKIHILLEIAEDMPNIEVDELKVKQIIYNLLSNAVKFTPEGGKIGIRAKKVDSQIEVVVWDTGIGIAPENMGKIFEGFFRVDTPFSRVTEGTGLGLPLSKKLVELHGGKFSVESDGLDKGTLIRFTLPFIPTMEGKDEEKSFSG